VRSYREFENIYLCREFVDFRKRINGLVELVSSELNLEVMSKALFLFTNKRRDQLNILYWDETGFCLWNKRLEKAKYKWPKRIKTEVIHLSTKELELLLDGYDIWKMKPHESLKFDCVS
jgi:transposase